MNSSVLAPFEAPYNATGCPTLAARDTCDVLVLEPMLCSPRVPVLMQQDGTYARDVQPLWSFCFVRWACPSLLQHKRIKYAAD